MKSSHVTHILFLGDYFKKMNLEKLIEFGFKFTDLFFFNIKRIPNAKCQNGIHSGMSTQPEISAVQSFHYCE